MTEKFIVLDTETTNDIDCPIAYDLGFAVIDRNGNIYEQHSFVVADVFLDEELMASAYFVEKIPMYWEQIKNGERTLTSFYNIRKCLVDVMTKYNIDIVIAHNARFDYISTATTQRYLTKSKYRYFFPYGTKIWDTLKMAREVFKEDENYCAFCEENNFLTKNGQNRYTAEILYRYLTNDISFEESHTGLEDVLIEKEIFVHCVQKNPEINGRLW
jgi:hypothetical protein